MLYERGETVTDKQFEITINEIITALLEKGYSPYDQITGYLETNSDTYITRHGDARTKIKQLDKSKLREYIKRMI